METLYATGMRVSELTDLKQSNVFADDDGAWFGKGSKRSASFRSASRHYIGFRNTRWKSGKNSPLAAQQTTRSFSTGAADRCPAQRSGISLKKDPSCTHFKGSASAYISRFVCHASSRRRSRPSRRAGDARSRGHPDDTNLYPYR